MVDPRAEVLAGLKRVVGFGPGQTAVVHRPRPANLSDILVMLIMLLLLLIIIASWVGVGPGHTAVVHRPRPAKLCCYYF